MKVGLLELGVLLKESIDELNENNFKAFHDGAAARVHFLKNNFAKKIYKLRQLGYSRSEIELVFFEYYNYYKNIEDINRYLDDFLLETFADVIYGPSFGVYPSIWSDSIESRDFYNNLL